jgi:hypothetical protein
VAKREPNTRYIMEKERENTKGLMEKKWDTCPGDILYVVSSQETVYMAC